MLAAGVAHATLTGRKYFVDNSCFTQYGGYDRIFLQNYEKPIACNFDEISLDECWRLKFSNQPIFENTAIHSKAIKSIIIKPELYCQANPRVFALEDMVGVHYRGTDKRLPYCPLDHNPSPEPNQFLNLLIPAILNLGNPPLYVATDDADFVDLYNDIPLPVFTQPFLAHKLSKGVGLHHQIQAINGTEHIISLLADFLNLLNCKVIFGCNSNLTGALKLFNDKLNIIDLTAAIRK